LLIQRHICNDCADKEKNKIWLLYIYINKKTPHTVYNWYRYINEKTPGRRQLITPTQNQTTFILHIKNPNPIDLSLSSFSRNPPVLCHFLLNYCPGTCNSKTSLFNNPTFAFFNFFCAVLSRTHLQRTVVCSHLQRTVLWCAPICKESWCAPKNPLAKGITN